MNNIQVTLKDPKSKEPAWLRALVTLSLEKGKTVSGIKVRDSVREHSVFVVFPPEVDASLRATLEPRIILAYQQARYPWVCKEHERPLHSLTLEILSGLHEFYGSVDLYCTQRDADLAVRKSHPSEDWNQYDYESVKERVEKIINKYEGDINQ